MFNNDDNNTSTSSVLERFKERLRQIKLSRIKKKQQDKEEIEKFTKEKILEINKQLDDNNKESYDYSIPKKIKFIKKSNFKKVIAIEKGKKSSFEDHKENKFKQSNTNKYTKKEEKQNKEEFIENIINRIDKTRKDRDYGRRSGIAKEKSPTTKKNKTQKSIVTTTQYKKNNNQLEDLKHKIISKIKTDFNKKLAELEVLESELNEIKEKNQNELELEKVKKIKDEINKIIDKINAIIEEYNIYRRNYDLEDIIDLPDDYLVDDIIEYKHLVENNIKNKELVKDYKLLKEFQFLYNKLEEIKTTTNNLVAENSEKITDLTNKESTYQSTLEGMKTAAETLEYCNKEIQKQNEYFEKLIKKVDIINKKEYTITRFQGLGNIFTTIMTFIGTMSLTRKLNTGPKIFIRTLATNYLLKNLYNSLQVDKVKKIEYSAQNYNQEILSKINDIDFTKELINDTLSTIKYIKNDFLLVYNPNIQGYEDTLKRLEKIEEIMINNRYQIDTLKNKLNTSKNRNNEKIRKLEKLKQSA